MNPLRLAFLSFAMAFSVVAQINAPSANAQSTIDWGRPTNQIDKIMYAADQVSGGPVRSGLIVYGSTDFAPQIANVWGFSRSQNRWVLLSGQVTSSPSDSLSQFYGRSGMRTFTIRALVTGWINDYTTVDVDLLNPATNHWVKIGGVPIANGYMNKPMF